ncbi:DoxX family protein [Roseomonas sp. GCM10028921]
MSPTLVTWAPRVLSILRIVAAFIFLLHGTQKLFAFPGPPMGGTLPPLMSQYGIGAVIELVGGLLLMFGIFTRPVAFLLSGEMAVAYWQFHFPRNFWPTLNGGDAAILYCFVFLYIFFAGPGPWSVDAARNRD